MAEVQDPQGTQPDPPIEESTEGSEGLAGSVSPAVPTRHTQAGYRAARNAVKEAAAPVVEQNAKDAQAAKKKAQAKPFVVKGVKEFNTKAAEVEAQLAERRAARAEGKK
ncbi:hypothetical protein SEA_MERCEDES_8 [Microbacterium phage Mercedes]|nr:hypothetical protein SEA_MERCEDES_8 [Microbacterium phage Mercedes]